jgi:hypothetical protein
MLMLTMSGYSRELRIEVCFRCQTLKTTRDSEQNDNSSSYSGATEWTNSLFTTTIPRSRIRTHRCNRPKHAVQAIGILPV